MAFFKYLGDVDPSVFATQVFGVTFIKGQVVEVTEAHAVAKLRANPRFEEAAIEDAEILGEEAPKRRGRPPKEALTDNA